MDAPLNQPILDQPIAGETAPKKDAFPKLRARLGLTLLLAGFIILLVGANRKTLA